MIFLRSSEPLRNFIEENRLLVSTRKRIPLNNKKRPSTMLSRKRMIYYRSKKE